MNHEETAVRRRPALRFARHALEMVIAMLVGMMVLGPVWSFAWPGLDENTTASALVMATNMSIGMAIWMRIRGHGAVPIVEMCTRPTYLREYFYFHERSTPRTPGLRAEKDAVIRRILSRPPLSGPPSRDRVQ